jgi:hypothetical protein
VESIIGAIYISDDFSPAGAEALFDNILKPFYDSHITLKTLSHHPTKILFELFQAQGCQSFEIVKEKDEAAQIARCDGKVWRWASVLSQCLLAMPDSSRAWRCLGKCDGHGGVRRRAPSVVLCSGRLGRRRCIFNADMRLSQSDEETLEEKFGQGRRSEGRIR